MKTRWIGFILVALALLSPLPGHAEGNTKYSQCLNTFKEKDGIQTGTIVKMATGEVFETMGSAFSYDKDLVSRYARSSKAADTAIYSLAESAKRSW